MQHEEKICGAVIPLQNLALLGLDTAFYATYELIDIHIMIILSYHRYQTCGHLHDLAR